MHKYHKILWKYFDQKKRLSFFFRLVLIIKLAFTLEIAPFFHEPQKTRNSPIVLLVLHIYKR